MDWSPLNRSAPSPGWPLTVIDRHGQSVVLEDIPTATLISPTLDSFNRRTILADGSVTISLHVAGGAISIGGGPYGAQTINALPISQSFQDFFRTSIQRLDAIVDLDFTLKTDGSNGEIDLFFDREINIDSSGGTVLGLALTNFSKSRGGWWETILNAPAFNGNASYLNYASLHELGHNLGLKHPFDHETNDGDVYRSSNPYESAYPEQTVMAYRSPVSGIWPSFYSDADIESLVTILGKELQLYGPQDDHIQGKNYSEKINGSQGNDWISGGGGNDELYGGKDNDWINGNQGHDWINGNMGNDTLRGGLGNDTIFGGKGDDQLFGDLGHDQLRGDYGDDYLTGGPGSDLFILSPGMDTVLDFNLNDGDRVGIRQGSDYSYQVTGSGTLISQGDQFLQLKDTYLDALQVSSAIQWI